MIKKPNGYDEVTNGMPTLDRGNYVCEVKKVRQFIVENNNSLCIEMQFDIAEGDFKGYYAQKYEHELNNPNGEPPHWKGNIRLYVPNDAKPGETAEDKKKRENSVKSFKRTIAYFEEANEGFHWDWNEESFVGKLIGIKFQPNDYAFDGKSGEWQKPKYFESVKNIREGRSKLLNKPTDLGRVLDEPVPYTPKTDVNSIPDEELPF